MSGMTVNYAIMDIEEPFEYLKDPPLFHNLVVSHCATTAVVKYNGGDITKTLGSLDDKKFIFCCCFLVGFILKREYVKSGDNFAIIKMLGYCFQICVSFT